MAENDSAAPGTAGTDHGGGEAGRQDGPDAAHRIPDGVDDATVEALGLLSEALETVERARGRLYDLHQLIGHADLQLGDAVKALREAGHAEHADALDRDLLGRNVISNRWTFQLVEDFDDDYYATWRRMEQAARDDLAGGRRHLHEARMKEDRRTQGRRGHEARP